MANEPIIAYAFAEGREAHKQGKEFHECPYDKASPEALSWRFGWNDRALQENA